VAVNQVKVSMNSITVEQKNLLLYQDFLQPASADLLFNQLLNQLAWSEETINMFGKPLLVPRLVCWYGDSDAIYKYSGALHHPLPWIDPLLNIKTRLESFTHQTFNSVLGNLYRNQQDSMGWHSDNEKELGSEPFIASVSLGETRIFKARHKTTRQQVTLELSHGSLLTMSGNFQQNWQHCIPKCKVSRSPRINLTYRYIFSSRQ